MGLYVVEHLSNVAREAGAYKVTLDCSVENVPFYQKCGYEIKGVQMSLYFEENSLDEKEQEIKNRKILETAQAPKFKASSMETTGVYIRKPDTGC